MQRDRFGVGDCDTSIDLLTKRLEYWRGRVEFYTKHHDMAGDAEVLANAEGNVAGLEAGLQWWQAKRARRATQFEARCAAPAPAPKKAAGAVVSSYEFSPADTFRREV